MFRNNLFDHGIHRRNGIHGTRIKNENKKLETRNSKELVQSFLEILDANNARTEQFF